MGIKQFESVVKTEDAACKYVKKWCWKNYRVFCHACRGRKVYRIRRGRYRCGHCRFEFTDTTGRWIDRLNISFRQWLWVLKLFELEVSARKAAHQMELSYPTVLKAFNLIRMAITARSHDADILLGGEVELDESYFGGRRKGRRGRGAGHKIPVFGILERNGLVKVMVVRDVTAEALLQYTITTVRRGSIVYTDKFKSYDTLLFCGYRHLKVDHAKRFAHRKVYINGLEGFWSYAKERLIKFHGVSKEKFPFYLKEMEFRYNHRSQSKNMFELLTKSICYPVANLL